MRRLSAPRYIRSIAAVCSISQETRTVPCLNRLSNFLALRLGRFLALRLGRTANCACAVNSRTRKRLAFRARLRIRRLAGTPVIGEAPYRLNELRSFIGLMHRRHVK